MGKWDQYKSATAKPASKWAEYRSEPTPADMTDGLPAPEADSLDVLKPTTPIGAAGRGITQGVTLGFGDEGMAAADTLSEAARRAREKIGIEKPEPTTVDADPALNPNSPAITKSFGPAQPAGTQPIVPEVIPDPKEPDSLAQTYRSARDSYRSDNREADAAHPRLYTAGELAGGLAVPLPGGAAKTVLGKVALGAGRGLGYGTALGAGKSEEDTVGGVVKDAAKGGAFGTAGGALGGVAEAGLGKLAGFFGSRAASAEAKAQDMVDAKALKLMQTALGSLGGETTAGRNAIEVMKEVVANPNSTAQQVGAAQALLNDPAAATLVQRVYKNAINNFPGRLGKIQAAEKAVQDAAQANTPAALSAAKDALLANPIRNQFLPRLQKQVINRLAAPALGAAAGAGTAQALGLDPTHGAELGGALGVGANALIGGHAATAWEKMLAHPAMQKMINEGAESVANGAGSLIDKAATIGGAELGAQPDGPGAIAEDARAGADRGAAKHVPGSGALPLEDAEGNPVPDLVIPRHGREARAQGRPAVAVPRRAGDRSVEVQAQEPINLTRTPAPSVDVQALPPTQITWSHPSTPEEIAADEEAKRRDRMMRLARFFSGNGSDDDLNELQTQR